jgi:outer membrane protein assembly factor BamA
MGSIDYHTFGLFLSYRIGNKKVILEPKLDLGYSIFNAKSVDYDLDNTSFLDYRYLSLAPKLNLHYKLSESFSLGIYGGYNFQLTALKGEKNKGI